MITQVYYKLLLENSLRLEVDKRGLNSSRADLRIAAAAAVGVEVLDAVPSVDTAEKRKKAGKN